MTKKSNRAVRKALGIKPSDIKKLNDKIEKTVLTASRAANKMWKNSFSPEARSVAAGAKALGKWYMGRGAYMVGRGSYAITAPKNAIFNDTFVTERNAANVQSKMQMDGSSVYICGKELVTKVLATGDSAYSVTGFSINPGLRSVFPWLSQIAANFAEYEAIQCVFEYEPVVSAMSVSSVGSLGNVILGVQYNAGAANFPSFAAISSSDHSVKGNIANSLFCGVECDPAKNANQSNLYIRTGSVPTGQDVKTYDLAKFQLAFDGIPTEYIAGTALGNLWVHYTVRLSKKIFFDGLGYNILTDYIRNGTTLTATVPLSTLPQYHPGSNFGCRVGKSAVTLDGSTGQPLYIPDDFVGQIEIQLIGTGTGLSGLPVHNPDVAGKTLIHVESYITGGTVAAQTQADDVGAVGTSTMVGLHMFQVPAAAALPGANVLLLAFNATTGSLYNVRVSLRNPSTNDPANVNWVNF